MHRGGVEKAPAERQDMKIFIRYIEVTMLLFDNVEIEMIARFQVEQGDAVNE